MARVIDDMEQRLAEPLTVSALASIAQLSPSRFMHVFRSETGQSPMAYLHGLRMERARLLLERTSLPVNDVMMQVGYRDPSHFARDFRRDHQFSPREYRLHASQIVRNGDVG